MFSIRGCCFSFSELICDVAMAARAREDVEKLDTRARMEIIRLRRIALVSF